MRLHFRTALLLATAFLAAAPAPAHEGPHPTAPAAGKMRAAATRLLETLPPALRAKATQPFEDAGRADWHYTPRSRGGVSLKELDARGREAVHALLREGLSAAGYRRVTNIIELELVLREVETFGLLRDPEKYHLTFYGAPDAKARWGWRFEGHHLSLHFTLAGDRRVADTPSFFGANPATVSSGPRKGLRTLAEEEDTGRALLARLTEAQRRVAVFDTRTYGDIVTTNAEKVDPLAPVGLAAFALDEAQRALLWKIVETYASAFEPGLAKMRLERAREGWPDAVRFGWAGETTGKGPHYYRIQGPRFLVEYDASQGGGNHIHTVWRDFTGDFGRDLLREHYATSHGAAGR